MEYSLFYEVQGHAGHQAYTLLHTEPVQGTKRVRQERLGQGRVGELDLAVGGRERHQAGQELLLPCCRHGASRWARKDKYAGTSDSMRETVPRSSAGQYMRSLEGQAQEKGETQVGQPTFSPFPRAPFTPQSVLPG